MIWVIAGHVLIVCVQATATITQVTGRKVELSVVAHDGDVKVGEGTHTRFVVNAAAFLAKAGISAS